ncbi:MAG: hypothetical protein BGO49_21950 [Planctomycetales bacterium 71-10]|nr:MAG: hypothetical protein BGO49_21950 [Planctomycetales bacterium 71-10]
MIVVDLKVGGLATAVTASKSRRAASRRRPSLRPRPELLEGRRLLAATGPYVFQAELTAASPPVDADLGGSVAVSQDGGTIAVVSSSRVGDAGYAGPGRVAIYTKEDGSWSTRAVLAAPDLEGGPWSTRAVAMSADGGRVVFSTSGEGSHDPVVLSVYDRSGEEWTSTQTITIPDGGSQRALALSGDGRVIAVGSPSGVADDPMTKGLVRVFTDAAGTWSQAAELYDTGAGFNDLAGISVSLSGDGRTLAMGVRNPADVPGAVDVFEDVGSGWVLSDRLVASEEYLQGPATALSADGRRLLAGGVQYDPVEGRVNARAYAFTRSGPGWTDEGLLPGIVEDAGGLPLALAINADGSRAVVGVDGVDLIPGSAFVYERSGSTWARIAELADPGAFGGGRFGASAAIGGGVVVVGDPSKDNGSGGGAAFVFYEPRGFEVVTEPADQVGRPLTMVTFTAAAAGAEGVTTRWQVSGDAGATWADVPQALSPYLSFIPTAADSGNLYRAVFTDAGGATVVTRAASLTVAEASPLITFEITDPHVFFYESFTITVRLHSDGSTPRLPDGGVLELGMQLYKASARVHDGVAIFTIPADAFRPGTYYVTATYDGAGDPVFTSGYGQTTQEIQRAFVSVDPQPLATRPVVGRPVDLTAIISQVQPGLQDGTGPRGYALFYNGYQILDAANLDTPPHPPSLPSTVTGTITFDRPGDYAIVVYYAGDDYNEPTASGNFFITVDPAPTMIQVDPPDVRHVDYGAAASYTVTVLAEGSRPASGVVTVTATDDAGAGPREYALDARGRAVVPVRDLPAGGHVVTFAYSDPNGAYTSSQAAAAIGVSKAPTTVTLASSRPTANPGDEVTFTATVAYASSASRPATGVVQFYEGDRLAATVPVGPDGRASVSTSGLVPGEYTLTAVYMESENLQASQSNRLVQRVIAPPTRAATTTSLASTASPSAAGQGLAFVAQVAGAAGAARPTSGLVRFYLGLEPIAERPIDAAGRATLEARFDAAGAYLMTAVYLGSDGFDTSQSGHLSQVVTAPASPLAPASPASAAPQAAATDAGPVAGPGVENWAARPRRPARFALRRPPAMRFRG